MLEKGWGGAEVLFRDFCIEMSRQGHSILAVVRIDSVLHKQLSIHSDSFKLIPVRRIFRKSRRWASLQFNNILQDFSPDIVVMHNEHTIRFFGRLNVPKNRCWPLVTLVPGPLTGETGELADKIIPHTNHQAKMEFHKDLVAPRFSEVVPVFSRFAPVANVQRNPQIKNLLAIGRFVPEKGFDILLHAMQLLTSAGCKLSLDIVGFGPEMENLVLQRDSLGLRGIVEIKGESCEIDKLMKQADLFVLPSVSEPFGIVLLEAMACGLPIVATKTSGPMEVLDDSSAILVESESASALSEGIQQVIHETEATFQRTCNALALYKDRYSAKVVVPKYIDVFQRCIEDKRSEFCGVSSEYYKANTF